MSSYGELTMTTRRFENVDSHELISAVAKMCESLGISGSLSYYNLYRAILDEQQRTKNHIKTRSAVMAIARIEKGTGKIDDEYITT